MLTNADCWGNRALPALLGLPARARVLTWLVLHPEQPVFLRDLARQCGLSVTPVHRQLVEGSARRYRLSPRLPALGAVKELIAATTGLAPRLRERLDRPGVECAFVFGSGATGEEQADSDVGLFVIGDIDGVLLANLHGSPRHRLQGAMNGAPTRERPGRESRVPFSARGGAGGPKADRPCPLAAGPLRPPDG